MKRSSFHASARAKKGAVAGAALGLVYGIADVVAAFIAIGWLFDPGLAGIALIAFTLVTAIALGGVLGSLVGGALPYTVSRRLRIWLLSSMTIAILVGGVVARLDRNHALEPAGAAPPEAKPVLFVVVDTTRADSLYGDGYRFPLAPRTGEWAKSALVFEDAESTAGWTIPSMAAMLTGVHNATFDASAGRLPLYGTTLAEHLRARGYETRAIVDNVILEPRNGFAQGFESFEQRSAFRFAFTFPAFRLWPIEVHEWLRGSFYSAYDGSTDVTDRAIDRIESAGERPLLLYVHYMDPHAPYYRHADQPEAPGEPVNYYRFRDYLREGVDQPPSDEQLSWLRGRYQREITHWDRDFGRLIEAWKARYGEEGLIVLTSDHGEEFLDHGRLGHGMTVHREMVHVPLIVDPPSRTDCQRSARVAQMVSLLDLTPTVVHWATGEPAMSTPAGPVIQGRSWVPWLCGSEPAPERPAFARHSRHRRRVFRYRGGDDVAMQIRYFEDPDRVDELRYDLAQDPLEQRPLPVENEAGETLFSSFHRVTRAFEKAFDPKGTDDEAKAVEESLRALGYIQ